MGRGSKIWKPVKYWTSSIHLKWLDVGNVGGSSQSERLMKWWLHNCRSLSLSDLLTELFLSFPAAPVHAEHGCSAVSSGISSSCSVLETGNGQILHAFIPRCSFWRFLLNESSFSCNEVGCCCFLVVWLKTCWSCNRRKTRICCHKMTESRVTYCISRASAGNCVNRN